jgi:hypothetical protein
MTQVPVVQPPRIAVWLLDLFISEKQGESIHGDLFEEFSGLASKSGVVSARRWYWRQSLKTIAHVDTGFHAALLRIAGAVLLGLLLLWVGFPQPGRAIIAIVMRYRYRFQGVGVPARFIGLVCVPLAIQIGSVIVAMSVGCVVAVAAKGAEMVATMMLSLALNALAVLAHLDLMWVMLHLPYYFFLLQHEVMFLVSSSIAIVIAGVIIRMSRSTAAYRFSGA